MTESIETDVALWAPASPVWSRRGGLAAAGARPLVLEARDRVGGRLLNEPIGDGKVVEVGGQWIGPTQRRIAALAAELGVATFPTHDEGRHLIEMGGKRGSYAGAFTDASLSLVRDLASAISPLALADFEQARARLDRMARQVPLEAPWSAPRARRWDGADLRLLGPPQHPHRRRPQPLRAGDRGGLGGRAERRLAPPRPLLHPLRRRLQHPDRDRRRRPAGPLPRRLAAAGAADGRAAGGGAGAALAAPVRRIEHGGDGVVLHADGPGGEMGGLVVPRPQRNRRRSRRPWPGAIAYDPPLPARRDQLTQRMPQGTVIKTMAIYETPFWREEGLSGQATSDVGPARVVFDNSPPDGSPGVLLGFLEGRLARSGARGPPRSAATAILAGHARLFGERAARPERFIERVWAEEEWTRGCYGCLMVHRRLDRIRQRPARADRPPALGRRRDRDGLERLHGRRRQLRRTRLRRVALRPRRRLGRRRRRGHGSRDPE